MPAGAQSQPGRRLMYFVSARQDCDRNNYIAIEHTCVIRCQRRQAWGRGWFVLHYARLVLEPALIGPESKSRIGDVEDFLAVHRVPAVRQLGRIVLRGVLGEVAVFEVRVLDLLAGQVAGAVADGEAVLAPPVNEVGRG